MAQETNAFPTEINPAIQEKEEETSVLIAVLTVVNYSLVTVLPPILATIGLVGNLLSYLLMNQSKYSKSTTCFYMRCLAIFDSAYVIGRMVLRYLLVLASDLFLQPVVRTSFCLFYLAFLYFAILLSPLILTVMSFDRFVALTWPLKAATLCTMRRSKQVTFIIVTIATIMACVQLLREHRSDLTSWYCPYHFKKVAGMIFDEVYDLIVVYIPTFCLLVCNTGIIHAVHKSNKDLSRLSQSQRSSSKEKTITSTTVLVTCIFIVSNIPMLFDKFYWRVHSDWSYSKSSKTRLYIQYFTLNFAVFMESLNYCLNFYIYGLSCRRFRKELMMIITCHYEKSDNSTRSVVMSAVSAHKTDVESIKNKSLSAS
jgi:hypothetical protein